MIQKSLIVITSLAFLISCSTEPNEIHKPGEGIYNTEDISDFKVASTNNHEIVIEFKNENDQFISYIITGVQETALFNKYYKNAILHKFRNGVLIKTPEESFLYYVDKSINNERNVEELTFIQEGYTNHSSAIGIIIVPEKFPTSFDFNTKFHSVYDALYNKGVSSRINFECGSCLYGGPGASECTAPSVTGASGGVTCVAGYYACCSLWDGGCCSDNTGGSGGTGGGTGGGPGGGPGGGGLHCFIAQIQVDEETDIITIIIVCI